MIIIIGHLICGKTHQYTQVIGKNFSNFGCYLRNAVWLCDTKDFLVEIYTT